MESQLRPPRQQLNLLQVFRGVAAILVLLFHVHLLSEQKLNQEVFFNLFQFGWAGVDFFFVLSGFIIFYTSRSDIGNKKRLKKFILKRFVRIYPIYWAVAGSALLFSLLLPSLNRGFNPSQTLQSLLLYPTPNPILNVSWTLTYEVFFYIAFSLLIVCGKKVFTPILICWLLGILLKWAGVFSISSEYELLNFLFSYYHLEFFAGCLAAYLVSSNTRYGRFMLYAGGTLFIILGLSVSYKLVDIDRIVFGIPAFLTVTGAASLEAKKSFEVPDLMLYFGDASYSIYLTHGPVISVLAGLVAKAKLGEIENNYLMFIVGGIALGFGCMCYSFVEKPLLKYSREKLGLGKSG
ncbi:MAG: acyltransferase [Oscillatoria princeps RMCB-10]|jgi:peptidoglycan/LPS O-acetylase OafA/YrhL|nr:acyltransferase [Oscillatoria princeps RMCB-10]